MTLSVISPCLPLSLPASTTTLSPFAQLRSHHSTSGASEMIFMKLFDAQLAHHRPEDPGSDRLVVVVEDDGGVAVEPDRGAVLAAHFLGGAHDDGLAHIALLHATARDRFLHRHDDDVADRCVAAMRAAEDLDALHPAAPELSATSRLVCIWIMGSPDLWGDRARPQGFVEPGKRVAQVATTSQRFVFDFGAHSWMRTMSPTLNVLFASWARYFLVFRTVFFITGCVKRRSTFTVTVWAFWLR